MISVNRRRAVLAVLCTLVLALLGTSSVEGTSVFMKLFPAKEVCVGHYVVRHAEGDPVKVGLVHRNHYALLANIRFQIYGPAVDLNDRGPIVTPPGETLELFGDLSTIYFDAEKSGLYTLCMKTRLRAPIMSMDISFVTSTDIVQPPTMDDDAVAIDKPVEMSDYKSRLELLRITIDDSREALRQAEIRRFMFDHTTSSILKITMGFSLFNMVLCVLLSWWTERYMKRFMIKEKSS